MKRISYHFFEGSTGGYYQSNRASAQRSLLVNCTGYFFTDAEFTTDLSVGRHDYYLLFIREGILNVRFPDGIKACSTGDIIIFPPDTPYYYNHKRKNEIGYNWVHFTGADTEKILKEYKLSTYPAVIHTEDDGSISSSFKSILDSAAKRDEFAEAELSILLNKTLLSIARRIYTDKTGYLHKAISYINSFYATDVRVPLLAKLENLSTSRFNALFTAKHGISPMQYILKTRLNAACDLLMSTDLTIKEISSYVGYDDPHYFSRIFKRHIGFTPIGYRNVVLNGDITED